MNLFSVIDEGVAIIRCANGVFKQTKVYQRAGRVYVAHGGGFIRVTAKFGETFGTSHPNVKVVELEAEGVDVSTGEPRFRATLKAAA
jgi:hypothetical protein